MLMILTEEVFVARLGYWLQTGNKGESTQKMPEVDMRADLELQDLVHKDTKRQGDILSKCRVDIMKENKISQQFYWQRNYIMVIFSFQCFALFIMTSNEPKWNA